MALERWRRQARIESELGDLPSERPHSLEAASPEGIQIRPAEIQRLGIGKRWRGEVQLKLVVGRGLPYGNRRRGVFGKHLEQGVRFMTAIRSLCLLRAKLMPAERVGGRVVNDPLRRRRQRRGQML